MECQFPQLLVKKFMHKMDKIFFSSTFGGESLSLRGSIATIEKIKKKCPEKTI